MMLHFVCVIEYSTVVLKFEATHAKRVSVDVTEKLFESFSAVLGDANRVIDAESSESPSKQGVGQLLGYFLMSYQPSQKSPSKSKEELFFDIGLHPGERQKGAIRSKGPIGDQPMLVRMVVE